MPHFARRPEAGTADALDAAFDDRISEMRRLLEAMAPPTAAAALTALRDAFPEVPLSERVRALSPRSH